MQFTYYGDDFTGSTDALDALARNGVPAVLFLDPPEPEKLKEFSHCMAAGVAGESRSRSPEWMSAHLPSIFQRLKDLGAPLCQYKVCSTFDSSPEIGSIGRALEIGAEVFQSRFIPVLPAAPLLGRYVVFSNLFAKAGDRIHRIDRHPTMSRHPVTPMNESDLRCHLSRQTARRIASIDILALEGLPDSGADADVLLFDGLSEASMQKASGFAWERRSVAPFVVGSSGFTHGLVQHWRSTGLLGAPPQLAPASPVDRLIVLSGSGSPVTERQIRYALANGFVGIRIDPDALETALHHLQSGRSVILYSALGAEHYNPSLPREQLAVEMGKLLHALLLRSGVRRAVVAGGDTSSHAVRQLGLYALTFHAPLAPGAPLCQAHSERPELRGLQLVLKGGQVGLDDFLISVMRGEVRS
jgi:3-oxoisoapionate kinase